jgi:hypothetical protein
LSNHHNRRHKNLGLNDFTVFLCHGARAAESMDAAVRAAIALNSKLVTDLASQTAAHEAATAKVHHERVDAAVAAAPAGLVQSLLVLAICHARETHGDAASTHIAEAVKETCVS